jgi:tRNA threonylcarbamoyladenosine biosynthesis protein TsaE
MNTGLPERIHSTSHEETLAFGEKIGARLCAGAPEGAVVLLIGPLGAGKTVLAKGIARGLGIIERVVSPTYTIVSEYTTGRRPLHHVDLYRIEGSGQLENLGLEDIMAGNGIVLIEWGEKLAASPGAAGPGAARVTITLSADGGRDILAEGIPA